MMTANHNLQTPGAGTTNWDGPINGNFERLDTAVEIRDTAVNLQNYTPKDRAKFLATDTGEVYIGDGDSWNKLGSIGGGGGVSIEGSGTSNLDLLSNGLISATGDGVARAFDPSNDPSALQSAIDALPSSGGTVRVPPREIVVDGPIEMKSHVNLLGFGERSNLKFKTRGVNGINFSAGSGYIWDCRIDGVRLDGPGPTEDTGYAIYDEGMAGCRFGSVVVRNWGNSALYVSSDSAAYENTWNHLHITQCDAGNASNSALIQYHGGGAPNNFNMISAYPNKNKSGRNSNLIYSDSAPHLEIGTLNIGGTTGYLFKEFLNSLHIGTVNYEPVGQASTPPYLFAVYDGSGFSVDRIMLTNGNCKHVYELYATDNSRLARPVEDKIGGGTVCNGEFINVPNSSTVGDHVIYEGSSAEVSGGGGNIACLSSMDRA